MTLIQTEATRMGRLVDDLLMLAQFDQDRPLERRPVDLSSIAARAVLAARLIQPGRPLSLRADVPVIVDGDAERLRQVLDNLIGNALQHTPRGSAVTVTVQEQAGQAQLTVADHGPGLTADQASHVFERFYRTDRTRTVPGAAAASACPSPPPWPPRTPGPSRSTPSPAAGPPSRSGCRCPPRSARRPAPVNRTRLPWATASVRPETSQPAATRSQGLGH